ncbi:proteasome component M29 [Arachnomyces sp. PD_36]|nr:proteasome component M29 [Arachnomyces sp. PD_36]
MSATSTPASSEARELELVSKVEFRFALADTDQKLQSLLQTYLPPLLLKLASEHLSVRNKVIEICHHINTRIKLPSLQLPAAALLKQFKDNKATLVRHFDLVYIQQGIGRVDPATRVDLLPTLLQGASEIGDSIEQAGSVFNLILRLLPLLKLPQRGSEEDLALRSKLGIADKDAEFLSSWFGKVILLAPGPSGARTCPALTPAEYSFLCKGGPPTETWDPSLSGGLNLTETKVAVAKFLASGAFTDSERFFPAVFASADTNSRIYDIGNDMLKRFKPDLEDSDVVERLYSVYFGTDDPEGAPAARLPLRVKVLSYLSRSAKAVSSIERIEKIFDQGAFASGEMSAAGLAASKLRNQIFSFVMWFARMGAPADLNQVAPKLINGFMEFIQLQGWPDPKSSGQTLSTAEIGLRSLAYECIGVLASKIDRSSADPTRKTFDIELFMWMFKSLAGDGSGDQMFVSIEQALGSLLNAFSNSEDEDFQGSLRPLLVQYMKSGPFEEGPSAEHKVVRSTRFTTLRFANRCLPYGDVQARWIDMIAIGGGPTERSEIIEEGKKGLDPYWYRMLNPRKHGEWIAPSSMEIDQSSRYDFPQFTDLSHFLFDRSDEVNGPMIAGIEISGRFSDSQIHALSSAVSFTRNVLLWEAFLKAEVDMPIDPDWEHRLDSIISTNESARSALRTYIRETDPSSVSNVLHSALYGLLWNDGKGLGKCGTYFVELCSLASNDILQPLTSYAGTLEESIYSNNYSTQDTAARAFGILASHPSFYGDNLQELIAKFSARVDSWKDAVGESMNKVRGALLSITFALSRLSYRTKMLTTNNERIQWLVKTLVNILENTHDIVLREAAQISIGELSLSSLLSPSALANGDSAKMIIKKLLEEAKKEKEGAILSLGRFSLIFIGEEDSEMHNAVLTTLYELHEIRRPEVQFAVGEALSTVAVGWESKSLVAAFDVDGEQPKSSIPSNIFSDMLEKVLGDCKASKPSLRKASSIWLLCLVQYCGHLPEIQGRLRQCQARFAGLLTERDEVVQETGSRGLSLVYEMGDQELKDDLVRDLVRSFTGDNANLGGKVDEDTELFEPGALPTGDGSVSTYKDIMSLASELGDPSLVYRFMSLASNNAIWSSRAAFGRFGLSNVLSDSSVNGYLSQNPKLYSKLFRYRFDPNTNVQRSMNDIWKALVKEPKAAVDVHFNDIMGDLLSSILAGKEWRVRQASCAAIADLIQGKPIEKYDAYIGEILNKAFKVLDDIKGSVRKAALGLCQVLTKTVIHNLESGDSESKRAKTMLGHVVPFLLSREGIESSAEEVQGYAVSTLIKIIKKSPGPVLRPFAPRILETFLGSLSSLEPQAVNYIHLNADKYGTTKQDIDKMRLSSVRMSPMMEAIEMYLLDSVDETIMKELTAKLEDVLRSAVDLPSKVGCSRVIVILCSKPIIFKPYADRFARLLQKYALDRNDTVSASYSMALGYLMRVVTDKQALKTIEYSKSLYFKADEASHRHVAGEILHSTSKQANDRFAAFSTAILPFVFVAKHDIEKSVSEIFDNTWKDNVGGSLAVSLYLKEILEIVSENLDSPRWATKHTSALAVADAVAAFDSDMDVEKAEIMWPVLEKAMAGKTWEGKEAVLEGFVKFSGNAKALWRQKEDVRSQMKVIAIREAKRNNSAYRPHALKLMGQFAENRDDLDLMPDVLTIVSPVIEDLSDDNDSEDKMDLDSGKDFQARTLAAKTLASAVTCLLQCLNPKATASASTLKDHLSQTIPLVEKALKNGGKEVQGVLYENLKGFLEKFKDAFPERNAGASELESAFVAFAGRLLFGETDISLEAVRSKRATAAVTFLSICGQDKFDVPPGIRQRIAEWAKQERAEPVQRILQQAQGKL